MKPPEVDRQRFPHESKSCYYSNLKVMRSPAGWYLGRTCWDKEDGFEEPYSRETDYYETEEEAKQVLKSGGFEVRDCAENNHGYATGTLPPLSLRQRSEDV